MIYHILNGDSLAYSFPETGLQGKIVVVREGLITGDLSGSNLDDFWKSRARYLNIAEQEYQNSVVSEFNKISTAPDDSEFNLWFEYDLFCQVNMWFVISLINQLPKEKKVFAVYTSHLKKGDPHFWNGYGPANTEALQVCFNNRILLTEQDLQFGKDLWNAYKEENLEALNRLSVHQSPSFPYIQKVIQAHLDRFGKDGAPGRPQRVLQDITTHIATDFPAVFKEFWKRESIYGFGDTQLKELYDKLMPD